jgi:hypothetical protein
MPRISDRSPSSILPPLLEEPSAAPDLPEIYTWTFPGSPVHIHLRLDAVANEQERLKQTGVTSPQGGLLLGRSIRPGTIEIAGFHPLPKLDAEAVKSALPKLQGQVAGFYRTTTGPLLLDDEDHKLAEEQFRDPAFVALVIGSAESGVSQACFFFRHAGMLEGDLPIMIFPFDRDRLSNSEQQRRSRPPERAIASEPVALADEAVPASSPELPRKRVPGWRMLGLVAVVVTGAFTGYLFGTGRLAAFYELLANSVRATASANLQFRADRQGDALLLSWNGKSPAVGSARFGMLLIRGAQESRRDVVKDVPLTADQLQTGVKLYRPDPPLSGSVALELNIIQGDRVLRESATVSAP